MYTQANYQNQPLPFNPQAPTGPWLQLSLNSPPYVPPVQVDPQVQPYLPLIAAAAAMEIQGKAQQNPLRTFMFNQQSVNNYANNDFAALVAAIADYVTLTMVKRQYATIDQSVQNSVPQVIEMLCAMNLRQFPGLEAFTDPGAQQAAYGLVQTFDRIAQEIGAMKRQMQQPQQPAFGGGAPGWNQPQPAMGGRPGWAQPAAPGWGAAPPLAQPATGSTGLFNSRFGDAAAASTDQRPTLRGRFDNETVRQPFTPREPAVQETPVQIQELPEAIAEVTNAPVEVLASSGKLKWKPSALVPYFPAYDPSKYVLFFKQLEDGSTEPVLKERTSVNYDQHALTSSVFGPVPKNLDLSKRADTLDRIQEGIRKINSPEPEVVPVEGSDATEEVALPETTTLVKKEWLAETSEATAWLLGGLDRLRAKDGIPDVFRVYAQIADPTVAMEDESDMVKNYRSALTFIELREKLNATVNEVSAGLWGSANGRMTKTVNRIIRQNLAIPSLWIESFVADIEDLLQLLGSKYGDAILGAFLKNQRAHIKRTLDTLSEDTAKNIADGLMDPADYADGKVPKITYLASNVTFTYLNCRAHELNIELSADASAAVTESLTPLMHSLLKGLFETSESEGEFERHLIRTNDGRVLEAAKGYIGQDFFLLTLLE